MSSSSNATKKIIWVAGTSSMLLLYQPHISDLLPSNIYTYEYNHKYKQHLTIEQDYYGLKHEVKPDKLPEEETEPIVDMPVIRSINVTFSKPEPLVFTSVENNRGFIE